MKTHILLFISIFFSLHSVSFSQARFVTLPLPARRGSGILMSDMMGNVKISRPDGKGSQTSVVLNVDSFPIFSSWPKSNLGGSSLNGGIYCYLESSQYQDIVYAVGNVVYAWRVDGSNVPGWPQTLAYNTWCAPAYGDIDGDGQGEVVVTARSSGNSGLIYAFKRDGTLCQGFPVGNGYAFTLALADLDGNGRMEIIASELTGTLTGQVCVYKGDGSLYPGWPQNMNDGPCSSCAVGDINGDGIPEIVCEGWSNLYAFDRHGNILPGFPFKMTNNDHNSWSSPVLVDLLGDGKHEIVFGTHQTSGQGLGFVYCVKYDGTIMPGWPKQCANWVFSPPSIGKINNTDLLDIC